MPVPVVWRWRNLALSDDDGGIDYDVEPAIVASMRPKKLFLADMLHFSSAAVKRVRKDHCHFVHDYELGAFGKTRAVFR